MPCGAIQGKCEGSMALVALNFKGDCNLRPVIGIGDGFNIAASCTEISAFSMKSRPFDCAVLVLGMHRSGTSAMAGVLAQCGLGLPESLIAPSESNERGFFESSAINELNNRTLADFNQTWLSLAPVTDDCWRTAKLARRKKELAALVAKEFASTTVPIIKDPRICRLLPLWDQALRQVSDNVRVAFIIRQPTEVASSLNRRNQIEAEFGLLLWARYNLDAEYHSRQMRRQFVTFDGLLSDWRNLFQKIDLPIEPSAVDGEAIDQFLSSGLRHYHGEAAKLDGVELVDELFGILSRWAVEGERKEDYPALDKLRRMLNEMGKVVGALGEKGRLESKRRAGLAAKSSALEMQLAKREDQLLGVVESVQQSLSQIEKRAAEFSRLMHLVKEKDRAVQSVAAENRRLEETLADEASKLEDARAKADAQAAELLALRTQLSEANIELKSVKRKYRSTQTILEREKGNRKRLAGQVEKTLARISELESARAFRLTHAVGEFGRNVANVLAWKRANAARRQQQSRLIRESELFDANWYMATYPDVAAARIDPAVHFVDLGWREGRNPSAAFCTTRYLRRYPDVAELKVNPLLHFIEHGSFEGREVFGVGGLPARFGTEQRMSDVPLPPAIPVYAGQRNEGPRPAWLRACQLVDAPDAFILDGLGLAHVSPGEHRTTFDAIIADFEALSGGVGKPSGRPLAIAALPGLQDAWFGTSHRLTTRWNVIQPTVIRTLQVDPCSNKLALVGESLVTSELDPVEIDLASPTLPLLFIATTCEGDLVAAETMAFPSLFRGGYHYPELVAAPVHGSKADPLQVSGELETQLRALRAAEGHPTVRDLEIDLSGSDGSEPLFRREIRDLLARVLMVGVSAPTIANATSRELYLQKSVGLVARQPCRQRGGTLKVAADMLPALGLLVACSQKALRGNRTNAMSMVVSDVDPSQPAVCFDPPEIQAAIGNFQSPNYPLPFPTLRGGLARPQLAAIRQKARRLDDAEYLMPDMAITSDEKASATPVDWLIDPADWEEALLAQSLMALSVQQGAGPQRLLFEGRPSPLVWDVACSFGSEPVVFDDIGAVLEDGSSSLVGCLGSGVVMHDPRTVAILSSLLLDPGVASASCVLVASTRHGKSWQTRLVDAGKLPVDGHVVFGPRADSPTEMIWRATYPVSEPPRLWLARPDDVLCWHSGDGIGKKVHLVTSVVTASLEGDFTAYLSASAVPIPASAKHSISARVLVG